MSAVPGGVTVVKCGGVVALDPAALCADVAALRGAGHQVVVVHGGSADIDRLAERLGVVTRHLTAPDGVTARFTDQAAIELLTMALAGVTKPRLVTALQSAGVPAIGLTGLDGGLLRARRKAVQRAVLDGRTVVVRDNHGGRLTGVDHRLLCALLADSYVPVVSPPALAEHGLPVNVDADRVAAAVAAALHASTVVFLTSVPGVLADPADRGSVLPVCPVAPAGPPPYTGRGIGLKLVAAREALAGGVRPPAVTARRRADPVRRAPRGPAAAEGPHPTAGRCAAPRWNAVTLCRVVTATGERALPA